MNSILKATLLALFAFALLSVLPSCGGKDEDKKGNGGEDVKPPDDDDDNDDDNNDDNDDDNDDDSTCVCNTQDSCCDGCNPINEGGSCDDKSICTQEDYCRKGVCAGEKPIECKGDGMCVLDGKCNEVTGLCDSEKLADGTECFTLEGKAGLCVKAVCKDFGSCDPRTYKQPPNYACNKGYECESGLCRDFIEDWIVYKYCSKKCAAQEDCPEGMQCIYGGEEDGYICETLSAKNIKPGDGSAPLHSVCNMDGDCEGDLCLALKTTRFCSKNCKSDSGEKADNSKCGDCGKCNDNGDELGFKFKYYCMPKGKQNAGEVCDYDFDCSDMLCWENYCSRQCFVVAGIDTCPEGNKCVFDVYKEGVGICVKSSLLDKKFGDTCNGDYQCASGYCANIGGESICSYNCAVEGCPEGECASIGEKSVSAALSLWKEGGESPLKTENYGTLTYKLVESGKYFIEMKVSSATGGGYYYLLITDESGEPIESAETEPNNSLGEANLIQVPANIFGHIVQSDIDVFAFEAEVETEKNLLIKIMPAPIKACLPQERIGDKEYGDKCLKSFECEQNLECYRSYCTKKCAGDGECQNGFCFEYGADMKYCVPEDAAHKTPDGVYCEYDYQCRELCFKDNVLAQFYCTGPCASDSDCTVDTGCFNGTCVKGLGFGQYPYSGCRVNIDCQTKLCMGGMCTAECQSESDCEGSGAYEAEEFGICWPCNPNKGDADCNAGGKGANKCITSNQVEFFCGTDCTGKPEVCPTGTRCYQINIFGEAVCAPVTLNCKSGSKCSTGGFCTVPRLIEGQPCNEESDCVSGICENKMCQSGGCSKDEDCGCESFACKSGYCAVRSEAGTLEVEPNNTIAEAQAIKSFPARIVASYSPVKGKPDVDIFKVSLKAGEVLDARTNPFCNFGADTRLRLLDSSGTLIGNYENEDIDPYGNFFSVILGYTASKNEDVFVEVSQSIYSEGLMSVFYLLDIDVFKPAANDTCDGAIELKEGVNEFEFKNATNKYTAKSCTGWAANGKDLTYFAKVPPNSFLSVVLTSPFDAQLYAVTDCSNTEGSCKYGSEQAGGGGKEEIAFINETASEQKAFIVVDTYLIDEDKNFTLEVSIEPITTPPNDKGEGAILIQSNGKIRGTTIGASDDYDPGVSGCSKKELKGADVVYRFGLEADKFLRVVAKGAFAPQLYIVSDYNDLSGCLAYGAGSVTFSNPAPGYGFETYYLIVDSVSASVKGNFELDFAIEDLGECRGPCDPATVAQFCVEPVNASTGLCQCDAATKLLKEIDCDEYCVGEGTLAGGCVTLTLDKQTSGCLCEYGCEDVAAQCGQGLYTNCTCSAKDPCGWKSDGNCDDFCAKLYPSDHFDDSADCP